MFWASLSIFISKWSPEIYCCISLISFSLLLIESSILIRSIPFEYSPNDSRGMTTSSFILNALVCLAIAAVRALSSQNRLLASEETAIKPSPSFAFAICTVLEAASPHHTLVITGNISNKNHFRSHSSACFGAISNSFYISLIQML